VAAILISEPALLSRYPDDVPDLLEHLLGKMLAEEPDARCQPVHEVRTELIEPPA